LTDNNGNNLIEGDNKETDKQEKRNSEEQEGNKKE
jgi:hypothetical protein